MRKSVITLNVIAWIFLAVGCAFLFTLPMMMGSSAPYQIADLFKDIGGLFTGLFKMGLVSIIIISVVGTALVLWIVELVFLIAKKRPIALVPFFLFLLGIAIAGFAAILLYTPGVPDYYSSMATWSSEAGRTWGLFQFVFDNKDSYQLWQRIIVYSMGGTLGLGFVLLFVGNVLEIANIARGSSARAPRGSTALDEILGEDTLVVRDDDLESHADETVARDTLAPETAEESAEAKEAAPEEKPAPEAPKKEKGYEPRPMPGPMPTPGGINGPLLVQYINTFAPEGSAVRGYGAPAEPAEKPLTADDIRQLIREELGEKKEAEAAPAPAPTPVIVTVPAPAKKADEPKALSADEIRTIIAEEFSKVVEEDDAGDVIVEEETEEVSTEEAPVDIRDVIRQELIAFYESKEEAARAKAEEEAKAKAEEEARAREIEEAKREAAAEALREREAAEAAKAAEEAAAAEEEEPAEEEPKAVSADDIRTIIAEELAKLAPVEEEKSEEPAEKALTAEDIRDIIRAELAAAKTEEPVKVAPVVVAPVVVEAKKAKEPVVEAPAEDEEGSTPYVRISFPDRLLASEQSIIDNYNDLKSEIMSYGVHSRVSNGGDSFRLHKVTFVKMIVAGKGLKLYLALDPKDYKDSKIPFLDASHKEMYRDIPFVFKVKSDLSLRRAKQLIGDVMEKHGINKGRVVKHDWASELKDYTPVGSADDNED